MEQQSISDRNLHSPIFRDGQGLFSRVTKPMFVLMSILGLQPYKPRNSQIDTSYSENKDGISSLKTYIRQFVTIGFLFWLPWLILGFRATYMCLRAFLKTVQIYGFFDAATVSAMQTWLLVQNGWIFVTYSFICAPKFIKMIAQLDRIVLSEITLKTYRNMIVKMVVLVLIIIICYCFIDGFQSFGAINSGGENFISVLFIFNVFCVFYMSLLCFIGPTAWLSVTSFFIGQGFKENRDQFKEAMGNQKDYANIRRIFFEYLRLTEIVELTDSVFAPIVLISVTSYVVILCTSILNMTAVTNFFSFMLGYIILLLSTLVGNCFCSIYLNDAVSFNLFTLIQAIFFL
jgi:hypothetical protein